jgi:hypothetical protein
MYLNVSQNADREVKALFRKFIYTVVSEKLKKCSPSPLSSIELVNPSPLSSIELVNPSPLMASRAVFSFVGLVNPSPLKLQDVKIKMVCQSYYINCVKLVSF